MSFDSNKLSADDHLGKSQVKNFNSSKLKKFDSNKLEQMLIMTNKKPNLVSKNDKLTKSQRQKMSSPQEEFAEFGDSTKSPLDKLKEASSTKRSSFVKNICNLIENKIQNDTSDESVIEPALKQDQVSSTKKLTFKFNEPNESSDTFTPKSSISKSSLHKPTNTKDLRKLFDSNNKVKINLKKNDSQLSLETNDSEDIGENYKIIDHRSRNNNNAKTDDKKEDKSKSKDAKSEPKKDKEKSKDKEKEKEKEKDKSGKSKEDSSKTKDKDEKGKAEKSDRRKQSKSRDKDRKRSDNSSTRKSLRTNEDEEDQPESGFNDLNTEEEGAEGENVQLTDETQNQSEEFNNELDPTKIINPMDDQGNYDFNNNEKCLFRTQQELYDSLNGNKFSMRTESLNAFKNSTEFSTSTKTVEVSGLTSSSNIFQYISNFLNATTPENKNLWLSIIESTGDSVINILTLKDEDNRNVWLTWLKDQCSRLDRLSQDLINDIELKIVNMDNKNF